MPDLKILAHKLVKGVVYRKCPHCGQLKPLADFGLRQFADGHVTNQSWCVPGRGGK